EPASDRSTARQASSTRTRYATLSIMPRFSGVSATTTLWCRRLRPSPARHSACPGLRPCRLFSSVTFSCFRSATAHTSTDDLFERLAALCGDRLRRAHRQQRVHRRPDDVDRVARAVALREHVAYARALEHRAHRAAG